MSRRTVVVAAGEQSFADSGIAVEFSPSGGPRHPCQASEPGSALLCHLRISVTPTGHEARETVA